MAIRSTSDTIYFMTNQTHSVQNIEIGSRNHEQRLDNFLLSQLKGVPKSRVYKLLRSGQVRVNKGRKQASYRLQSGDMVRIPPVRMSEKSESEIPDYLLEKVRQAIMFENNDILVLNKPAGLAVHSGSNIPFGVIEILRQARPDDDMLELVHRLDRDTSGCLLIAKSRSALNQLHALFRDDHAMEKVYRTIVAGRWRGGERMVEAPLLKNTLQGGERMVMVDEEGKTAKSLFQPVDYFSHATLMDVQLFTGRTHQIRVHATHEHHPIAGDTKYGDKTFNQALKKAGFKRMYLHAHRLAFKLGNESYNFTAPLDDEWAQLIQHLKS